MNDTLTSRIKGNMSYMDVFRTGKLDEDLVMDPHKFYSEWFKKMGIKNYEINIILADIPCYSYHRKPINHTLYTESTKIYYKKNTFYQEYNNDDITNKSHSNNWWTLWREPGVRPRRKLKEEIKFYKDLILRILSENGYTNPSDNEYIIAHWDWDRDYEKQGPRPKEGESWEGVVNYHNYRFVLVEYNRNCLSDFSELRFYNVVKNAISGYVYTSTSSTEMEDFLIQQGRKTLNGIINNTYDLYDKIHNLSLLRYEGEENKGKILFMSSIPSPVNENIVRFKNSISLKDPQNLRKIRKLLEISTDNLYLLSDGENIYGITEIPKEDSKGSLWIKFKGQGCWEFINEQDIPIMSVSNGVPSLPKQEITPEGFLEKCIDAFGESKYNDKLWNFINKAKQQKHGTMVVITDAAVGEANRLSQNAFPIVEEEINLDFVNGLTSIDGAIMLDPFGKCHSIGCILDGVSKVGLGDSSRGARFNSALRYINHCVERNINVLVVIVSEDGMIDIKTKDDLPRLVEGEGSIKQ